MPELSERQKFIREVSEVNHRLIEIKIPEKCAGCEDIYLRSFVLAGRVALKEVSETEAAKELSDEVEVCKGSTVNPRWYDAQMICDIKERNKRKEGGRF